MCTNFNNDEDNREKAFECFSPWVKYCLEETNSYVIPESLNFFILFNTLFPHFLSVSIKDFFGHSPVLHSRESDFFLSKIGNLQLFFVYHKNNTFFWKIKSQ